MVLSTLRQDKLSVTSRFRETRSILNQNLPSNPKKFLARSDTALTTFFNMDRSNCPQDANVLVHLKYDGVTGSVWRDTLEEYVNHQLDGVEVERGLSTISNMEHLPTSVACAGSSRYSIRQQVDCTEAFLVLQVTWIF
ncbi:hypothetical protein J6590_000744 [Homalodisca vitripennis]|nr:hypothetical protein J6590_000744 [Homalodisca vitripennis]